MKFSHYLKSIFYKDKIISSAIQLEKDFFEFPPFPLVNRGLESKFNIVNVYGPGRSLYFLKLFYSCFSDEEYQLNKNLKGSSEIINARESFQEQRLQIRKSFSDMVGVFKSLSLSKRIFIYATLIGLSPLLLLASLIPAFYLSARFGMIVVKLNRITFGSFGAFVPLVKGKEVVVLRPNLAKKNKIDISAIISHEHIHFLQYINADFHQKVTINSPEVFVKEKLLTRHTLYLFERNEVEARLHELVLSYYRKFRKLPQELDGFIGIFLASHEISPVLKKLASQEEFFSPLPEEEMFFIREKKVADDLILIFLSFKKEDHVFKFITEVMATMYGNLLKLYGDKEASNAFKYKIEFPNFYDRLYGEIVGAGGMAGNPINVYKIATPFKSIGIPPELD